jgi:hypothetical protein
MTGPSGSAMRFGRAGKSAGVFLYLRDLALATGEHDRHTYLPMRRIIADINIHRVKPKLTALLAHFVPLGGRPLAA